MNFCLFFFPVSQAHAVGTVIGAVLATNKEMAQEGVRKVKVEYKELEPILTIKVCEFDLYFTDNEKIILGTMTTIEFNTRHTLVKNMHSINLCTCVAMWCVPYSNLRSCFLLIMYSRFNFFCVARFQ